jgi:Putative GTPase activating protein for Arf
MTIQKRTHSQRLLDHVATELDTIQDMCDTRCTEAPCRKTPFNDTGVRFPTACLQLLRSIPGNQYCVDCGAMNPDWASITYGTLLCLQCSGKHRSYGVQVSFVRSLEYDTWNHAQILSMLEGGNTQLRSFFHRHHLLNNCLQTNHAYLNKNGKSSQQLYDQRYHTKAALFYKVNLANHVERVAMNGVYQGREYNRKRIPDVIGPQSFRSKSPTTVVESCLDSMDQAKVSGKNETCRARRSPNSSTKCFQLL